jgi:uncharacterized protein YciI
MLFVVNAMDKPDGHALRVATRPAHLDYVKRTGVVKLGGPYLDNKGQMIGSLIILDVEDLAAAEAWARNDPYALAGLFETSSVTSWKAVLNATGINL